MLGSSTATSIASGAMRWSRRWSGCAVGGKTRVIQARERATGWPRFEWWVLDWNEPAHRFYESIGARPENEWTTWRLDGNALGILGVET